MSKAILVGANLSQAGLGGAHLDNANLVEANLLETRLNGVQLHGANLSQARLIELRTDNKDQEILQTDLSGTKYDSHTKWPDSFTPPSEAIYKADELSDEN